MKKPSYRALADANRRAATIVESAFAQTVATQRCKAHPKYEIKRAPRVPCETCWRMWITKRP